MKRFLVTLVIAGAIGLMVGCQGDIEDDIGEIINMPDEITEAVEPSETPVPTPTARVIDNKPTEAAEEISKAPELSIADLRATMFPEPSTTPGLEGNVDVDANTDVDTDNGKDANVTPTQKPTVTSAAKPTATPVTETPAKPTATPKPKPTATPTPKPTSEANVGGDDTFFGGKCNVYYNSTSINTMVYIGGKSLKDKNDRSTILIGDKAAKLLPSKFDDILRSGYQWCVVHFTVVIDNAAVGYSSNCIPDILIRASNGNKLNAESAVYYVEALDANSNSYDNSSRYDKEYDLVFQLPKGVDTFTLEFGRQISTVYKFKYTGQKVKSLITY